jgi:erythromycin esterase-like protein
MRADICRRLIVEKGFDAIAVEADWPDALRVSGLYSSQTATRPPIRPLRDSNASRKENGV